MADEEAKKPSKEEKAEKPDTKGKKDKKGGEETDEDEDKKGGGLVVALVAILVVIIWLAIFALLIKTDVGGFGSTVMYPILKDVPYLNKILPEVKEQYAEEDSAYQFATMDQAVARIKELEGELKAAQDQSATDAATLADLQAQAAELQTYKQNEARFEQEKQQFYEDIVYNDKAPDTSNYRQYYEEIEPDNAEAIYKQVVQQDQADSEIQDYAKTYSSMKASQAAGIFDTMTDNLDLVAKILNAMSASNRGAILGAMNADTAAKVTEIMNPK